MQNEWNDWAFNQLFTALIQVIDIIELHESELHLSDHEYDELKLNKR